MTVHTIFALIDGSVIKNVCVGDYGSCNKIAQSLYGQNAFAKEVTQYPVEEGDKYEDGEFRRYTGTSYTVIKYIPTDREEIESLKEDSNEKAGRIDGLSTTTEELFATVDNILTEVIPSLMG